MRCILATGRYGWLLYAGLLVVVLGPAVATVVGFFLPFMSAGYFISLALVPVYATKVSRERWSEVWDSYTDVYRTFEKLRAVGERNAAAGDDRTALRNERMLITPAVSGLSNIQIATREIRAITATGLACVLVGAIIEYGIEGFLKLIWASVGDGTVIPSLWRRGD